MVQPWVMTSSDGDLTDPTAGKLHLRSYGSFPRKIRKYVLEDKVIDLANAVRSITSLPASVFRMKERGLLKPGYRADIVLFDAEIIGDTATFEEPRQLSRGMSERIDLALVLGAMAKLP